MGAHLVVLPRHLLSELKANTGLAATNVSLFSINCYSIAKCQLQCSMFSTESNRYNSKHCSV